MISGVLTMLVGEMLFLGSRVIAIWAATFLGINQVYFMLLEEPGLERRFGTAYREYKLAVPRWIPRATPWQNT
jgi:protein-S-isoprenylcysteine O-methyltransferase Ste14